jgi:peptidoglycan biosynthesis protein MviN/MurJ (putative lipid II flippase)
MTTIEIVNGLAVVVLIGFIVALAYLIALLYRANRMIGRIEHLSTTFRSFVADIVPAMVNVGTVATAMESVLRGLHHKDKDGHPGSAAPKDRKK